MKLPEPSDGGILKLPALAAWTPPSHPMVHPGCRLFSFRALLARLGTLHNQGQADAAERLRRDLELTLGCQIKVELVSEP